MTKRGIAGCSRFCNTCHQDCTCETCNHCHSCQNAMNVGYGVHRWVHNCTGRHDSESKNSVAKLLLETSEKFSKFFETPIITLKVGDDRTCLVHEEALTSTSAVLKKQITSKMKEGETREILLKDCTDYGESFNMFIQFCYFGGYGYNDRGAKDALLIHAHVYVLAERLEALDLKQLALRKATALCSIENSASQDQANGHPTGPLLQLLEVVPIIYNNTYDINTGKHPSVFIEQNGKDKLKVDTIKRDGFRLLLSKFTAAHIKELCGGESFNMVLQEFPAFGADVLMFASKGEEMKTDGHGNLVF